MYWKFNLLNLYLVIECVGKWCFCLSGWIIWMWVWCILFFLEPSVFLYKAYFVELCFLAILLLQPVERSRKRLMKTYEVKFCFMQQEKSYIRLKKRLPIKNQANLKRDRRTSFFRVVSHEKLCLIWKGNCQWVHLFT